MATRRKCLVWFLSLNEGDKRLVIKEASFKICCYLKQGWGINVSKAMTRDDLNLGFKLIDHIARSSMQVLNLQHSIKQENISKQTNN